MEQYMTHADLARYEAAFHAEPANLIAMNTVAANGLAASAKRAQAPSNAVHQYSIRIEEHGITNQKHSGRCWMFAALNCMRAQVIKKLNLDRFELSQNYTHFYDKLEKSNYFLECILDTLNEDSESRVLQHLLRSPVSDGGQWDMIRSVMEKYGVVPKEAMPETACSEDTGEMNHLLNELLRTDACRLREAGAAGSDIAALREMKGTMMRDVYRLLCICLGTPPERFDFCIRNKDKEYIADRGLTPKEFFDKYVGLDLGDYISLINSPTKDKPYLRSYTVKYLGNVADGTPVRYVNAPIEVLKDAAIAQMKDGESVWFGCDVGKQSDRVGGVMDLKCYDYETLTGTEYNMTKADRLDYGSSMMTHAMVFRGVDLDEDGRPVRWCVENSWGEDRGKKGMYLMTDDWFNEYMYQVVVNKKYVSEEVLKAYQSEPIVLAPWDPMGSLA